MKFEPGDFVGAYQSPVIWFIKDDFGVLCVKNGLTWEYGETGGSLREQECFLITDIFRES